MILARELKKPVEDMVLKDSKVRIHFSTGKRVGKVTRGMLIVRCALHPKAFVVVFVITFAYSIVK